MRISDWSSDVCSSDLDIAKVDHDLAAHRRGHPRPVEGQVLLPLRQHHGNIGIFQTGPEVPAIGKRRAVQSDLRHLDGAGVMRPYLSALARESGEQVERRRLAHVVGVGLEGKAEHCDPLAGEVARSEEHTSELQSLMRNSSAVFCLKKKK